MKKFIIILFIAFIQSLNAQSTDEFLIAYWSFNDSTAKDNSGNNLHGTIHNDVTPTLGVDGNNAFHFRGEPGDVSTGGHIIIPPIDFTKYPEFTISLWVNEEDFSTDWGESYIWFGDFNFGYLGIDHCWPLPDKIKYVHFAVGSGVSIDPKPINVTYDFQNYRSRWIQYCLVYKNNMMYGYIDGKLVGAKQQAVLVYDNNAGIARHWWKYLGENRTSTRFIGSIDEVKIYSKALTKKEIEKEFLIGKHFEICNDEDVTLAAPNGYKSYKWSTGVNNQSIVVNQPGSYTVTVVNDDNDTITSQPYTVTRKLGTAKAPDNLSFEYDKLEIEKKFITLNNPLNEKIVVGSVKFKGSAGNVFDIKSADYPIEIAAGSSHDFEFYFEPVNLMEYTDTIIIGLTEPCKTNFPAEVKAVPNACDELAFEYNEFDASSNLVFVEKAGRRDNYIRLTTNKVNQRGAVWYGKPLPVKKGFTTEFGFRMSEGSNANPGDNSEPGADGIVFVLQNAAFNSIGLFGGNLGYAGIPNSIAFEIDLFSNDRNQIETMNDPNGNHAAIQSNGSQPNSSVHESPWVLAVDSTLFTIKSHYKVYYAKIEYNIKPNTLNFYIDSTKDFRRPAITLSSFDLGKYVSFEQSEWAIAGFTSATGTSTQNHDLMYWKFCPVRTDALFVGVAEDNKDNADIFEIVQNSGSVHFKFAAESCFQPSVSVYNLLGSCVYQSYGDDFSVNLPNGLYIYNVRIGRENYTGKILVY